MAEKYKRIDKAQEVLPSNEIRVKRGVGIGRYLKRAYELLTDTENSQETITIKGVSNAVESAVKLSELIKHRIKGLHQNNKISHITIVDEYEPLEEGLDHLKFTRIVTMLEIVLSKVELDTTDIGYQAPIDESEVQEYSERQDGEIEGEGRKRRSGRRPRGGARGGARGGSTRGRGGTDGEQPKGDRPPRKERTNEDGDDTRGDGEAADGGNKRKRTRRPRGGADGEEVKNDRKDGEKREYTGGDGTRAPRRGRPQTDNNRQPREHNSDDAYRGGSRRGGGRGRGGEERTERYGGDRQNNRGGEDRPRGDRQNNRGGEDRPRGDRQNNRGGDREDRPRGGYRGRGNDGEAREPRSNNRGGRRGGPPIEGEPQRENRGFRGGRGGDRDNNRGGDRDGERRGGRGGRGRGGETRGRGGAFDGEGNY